MARLAAALAVLTLLCCVARTCGGPPPPAPRLSGPPPPTPGISSPPTPISMMSSPPSPSHGPPLPSSTPTPPPPTPMAPSPPPPISMMSSPPPPSPGSPSPSSTPTHPPPAPMTLSPPPPTPRISSPPPPMMSSPPLPSRGPPSPSSTPPPPPPAPITPSPPPPTPKISSPPPPVPITPSPPPLSTPSPPPPTPITPNPPPPRGLAVGYYKQTCYKAEYIVRATVLEANAGTMAGLIRLFFHDCFVRGCDASVLLDKTDSNSSPEKLGIPNLSLRGFEVIDAAKAKIEKECNGVVSCADILAFAARDATFFLSHGKVLFDMPAGRYDGNVSLAGETFVHLPPPFATVDQLKATFASKGLTVDEMVTLSGAHSVGSSHCSSFSDRLSSNTSTMDPTLRSSLQNQCRSAATAGGDNMVVQDLATPDSLDNQYYKNVISGQVLFKSDAALMAARDTSTAVRSNAEVRNQWEEKFKAAMVRMGAVEVKTKAIGEIRRTCRLVNTH